MSEPDGIPMSKETHLKVLHLNWIFNDVIEADGPGLRGCGCACEQRGRVPRASTAGGGV